ncbi:MAG TPA: very short patch repair endonuclease [Verrucomicrobiae bacterium]|nr:very short patch repair endonuclease [Verrucomicrobiae bacterium]
MPDIFTKEKRSQVMSRIRSRGNKETELRLASILRAHGITGWRRHQSLPGRPDFTFRRKRVVIFVDGCFWHGCPKHGRKPATNRSYWLPKLKRNAIRDRLRTKTLRNSGWRVIRFWSHDLNNPNAVASRIIWELSPKPKACKHTAHKHERPKRQISTKKESESAKTPPLGIRACG